MQLKMHIMSSVIEFGHIFINKLYLKWKKDLKDFHKTRFKNIIFFSLLELEKMISSQFYTMLKADLRLGRLKSKKHGLLSQCVISQCVIR